MARSSDGMSNPLVSIVLPFVNEGDLLREAVQSITAQTYSNFELLLIDNHANSSTVSIAKEFASTDRRLHILQENIRGISHALNTGISAAKGELIARMDADDIAHPERIKKQVEHLIQNPDTGVVSCSTTLFPENENNKGFREFISWQNGLLTAEDHQMQRFIESPLAHPAVMIRKNLFDTYGLYSTGNLPEDYELWLRLMDHGVKFEKLPQVLLHWRDRPQRLSREHSNYHETAFTKVRSHYLARCLSKFSNKKIVVCGSSKNIQSKIKVLEQEGVMIYGVTDVNEHSGNRRLFIPIEELSPLQDYFVLNLIARRDLRQPIHDLLQSKGFIEGSDFLMAG
jgi:glycosyltransferase involved in cell wall biosynthesis